MKNPTTDPFFCVETVVSTENPQQLVWLAAHQDYSSSPVYQQYNKEAFDNGFGERVINMLLAGDKGHFGCLEHPQITFNCCYFPHSAVMQARTHRVGISFDVQSFRYTSASILRIKTEEDLHRAFYFRPEGQYTDREGKRYYYLVVDRLRDISRTMAAVEEYKSKIAEGYSEEHARDCLPSNYRQHFIVSFNLRSLFHFFDLRAKKDSQLEIQQMSLLMFNKASLWCPELCAWYEQKRWSKAKLSP